MYYISYEGEERVLMQKFEREREYARKLLSKSFLYPNSTYFITIRQRLQNAPLVTFHHASGGLLVRAHKDIYDPISKKTIGHIEISSVFSQNYFLNVSRDLNMHVRLSDSQQYASNAISIFEPYKANNFKLTTIEEKFVSSISFGTDKNVLYIVFDLDKYENALNLAQHKTDLFLFLAATFDLSSRCFGVCF